MNRYIDAEWLKGRVHNVTLANGGLHGCIDKLDIHEAPSIDLVFCEECIHFTKLSDGWGRCNAHDKTAQTIDFCSWGERKDDE